MSASKTNPVLWKKRVSQATQKLWDEGKGNGFKKGHAFVGRKINEIMAGRPNPNLGKKHSEERKRKLREAWQKRKSNGFVPWNKGKKCPNTKPYFTKGHTLTPKGSAHWNWKGGTKTLVKKIRELAEYTEWRCQVFIRDNFTCASCGKRGGILQADHIVPFSEIILKNNIKDVEGATRCKGLWDLKNGRTLCIECHKKTDSFGLKQARRLKSLSV